MTTTEIFPDADAQLIRDGIALACLHGTDRDWLDTPEGALRLVAVTSIAADRGGRLLGDAVAGARHTGHIWAAIGSVLGVSKQAAQQCIIRGVTAFNETLILEREQADGWHLVGFGAFKLVAEVSDHPWEHQRLTFVSHALLRTMGQDGWQYVFEWGSWTYLKRPTRTKNS